MDPLVRLVAIEEIRQLKARYWRAVDAKDGKLLRSVFADDAVIDFREDMPEGAASDLPTPDTFVQIVLSTFEGVDTMHHGHEPEIAIETETTASAVWPMEDNLWVNGESSALPFRQLNGYGRYHDKYIKTAQGWKISYTTLKRARRNIS